MLKALKLFFISLLLLLQSALTDETIGSLMFRK